jgi:hypothetical protein
MVSRTLASASGTRKSTLTRLNNDVQMLTGLSDFLKERLFGLSNPQGNHGESVKEAHFHLDNTPVSLASSYTCEE